MKLDYGKLIDSYYDNDKSMIEASTELDFKKYQSVLNMAVVAVDSRP